MHGFSTALASVSMLISGAVFAPALFLRFRAAADPEGIVDGLLRVSWFWPLLWLLGLWLWSERRLARTRGLLAVHVPLLLALGSAMTFWVGWLNDGAVIIGHAPPELTRSERNRKAKGEAFYKEADFGLVAPLAKWGHEHLPPHPFGEAPRSVPGA